MKKLCTILILIALLGLPSSPALADDDDDRGNFRATLTGYEEVPSISSPGAGKFRAKLTRDGTTIEYRLSYSGLQNVVAAHIHLGQFSVNGGVAAFLCGGSKPACPPSEGTVNGTITAADVIGPAGQGIAPGELEELVAAMDAGVTYVNVHTNDNVEPPNTGPGDFPAGEIRGQIK
jgi:hypothetical protein